MEKYWLSLASPKIGYAEALRLGKPEQAQFAFGLTGALALHSTFTIFLIPLAYKL